MPEIYPINFVAHDRKILFRTNPRDELLALTINETIALETGGAGTQYVWSLVVKGKARRLESGAEIEAAERIPRQQLTFIKNRVFIEIVPTSVTGRCIHRGAETDELTPATCTDHQRHVLGSFQMHVAPGDLRCLDPDE